MSTHHEYSRLIAVHDGTISQLRKWWINAPIRDKASWMVKLDDALDERLRLMALRDEPVCNPS